MKIPSDLIITAKVFLVFCGLLIIGVLGAVQLVSPQLDVWKILF